MPAARGTGGARAAAPPPERSCGPPPRDAGGRMDEQKPPSEEKDADAPADGAVASEEMGSAEGDPLKPPEGASAGPELESVETKTPPRAAGEDGGARGVAWSWGGGVPSVPDTPCPLPSTPARRCALCNCGDWSPHGQRELQCFEPAPDWPERLAGHEPPEGPGQPPPEPEPAGDDLAQIGFSERVTPVQLFEPTGERSRGPGVPIPPPRVSCPARGPPGP
ncbi:LOW QUALITY PROTEIN: histone-lysine N-methyltransferase 2D-like [Theristicus caerulescens]